MIKGSNISITTPFLSIIMNVNIGVEENQNMVKIFSKRDNKQAKTIKSPLM
jgi:hypothetical protein